MGASRHRRCAYPPRPSPNPLAELFAPQTLWILYFTSSDDAWFASVFDIGSSIHFSSRSSVNGTLSGRLGNRGPNGSQIGMAGPASAVTYQNYQGVHKGPGGPGSIAAGSHVGPASVSVQDLQMEQQSPNGTSQSLMGEGGIAPEYTGTVLKARALYSCVFSVSRFFDVGVC